MSAIHGIDSLLERSPRVKEPVEVVRRLQMEELGGSVTSDGFKPRNPKTWSGKEFKAWGFLSTSTHANAEFGEIEMRLTVPKGTKAVYVGWDEQGDKASSVSSYPEEEELLLGRGIRYRIDRVRRESGTTVVYAEVIG
ncbi:ADP-ribosyltransferase [Corynebacterium sp.]|uniref:ADP-ribosyltransferase n=1 Tax=Corynebacterium sp. TaxID=1720 RepID=UPI0026DB9374|nr:ADP-ribosyltransferase [Corynebacterium sp.]MDO5033072.1 ADP-ribosyltransferase [Corynebacterium sp.]